MSMKTVFKCDMCGEGLENENTKIEAEVTSIGCNISKDVSVYIEVSVNDKTRDICGKCARTMVVRSIEEKGILNILELDGGKDKEKLPTTKWTVKARP